MGNYTLGFQPPLKQRGFVEPPLLMLGPKYYSSDWFIFLCAQAFFFSRVKTIFQTGRAEVIHRGEKQKYFQKSTCSFTGREERMSKSKVESSKDFRTHLIFD